jgi:lipoprotein-anchoring transpeptidase ErfK/SrfK
VRTTRLGDRRVVAVLAAGAVLVAGAATGVALTRDGGRPSVAAVGEGSGGGPVAPAPPVVVTVRGLAAGTVKYGRPATLRAHAGRLADVAMTDGTGRAVPGAIGPAGLLWHSTGVLVPGMEYTAVVQTVAADGRQGTSRLTFRTRALRGDDALTATVTPDGGTYGVGMPIVAYFDHDVPVAKRAAVERRFTIRSSSRQVGAWHWLDARTAHWRPAQLWTAYATVSVRWNLARLALGSGLWGDATAHATSFRIGAAHVSTVDAAAHYMAVRSGGRLLRLMPVSTGRPKYASKGGPHIVLSKERQRTMDSATVGIPKGDPDYYYETVYWDTRISNGGMFVHAAPWSLQYQGKENVSHGCVNASTPDAEWFYFFSRVGDVVNVINTPAEPLLWDAGTADWTISWRTWLADDPAHPHLSPDIPTDPALLTGVPRA